MAVLMAGAFDPAFGEAWSAQQILGTMADAASVCTVAEVDGELAGLGLLRTAAGEAELLLVATAPAWRRQGVAGCLIGQTLAGARALGATAVFLEVRDANEAARALYVAHGFITVGRRPGYYGGAGGRRYDATTMRRSL